MALKFPEDLIEGTLVKRYKRFLADVLLPGQRRPVLVHVPNSGSMKGCAEPGSAVLISRSKNPGRKIPYTLEMVQTGKTWIGVNTANPNKIMYNAFQAGLVKDWKGFNHALPEVKVSENSRIDLLLRRFQSPPETGLTRKELDSLKDLRRRYVEIKNVSYSQAPRALFPDSVTERGLKHLRELEKLVKQGFEAEICFVVQREDCSEFDTAHEIDPAYARGLLQARRNGVLISCWSCRMKKTGIEFDRKLKINLTRI